MYPSSEDPKENCASFFSCFRKHKDRFDENDEEIQRLPLKAMLCLHRDTPDTACFVSKKMAYSSSERVP